MYIPARAGRTYSRHRGRIQREQIYSMNTYIDSYQRDETNSHNQQVEHTPGIAKEFGPQMRRHVDQHLR